MTTPRPTTSDDSDDRLADALAAYHDAHAGPPPADPPAADRTEPLPPDDRGRWDANRAVLHLLDAALPPGPPPPPPAPGTPPTRFRLGRFKVRAKLGSGGFGVVYLADDPVLGRPVALKVPRPEALVRPDLRKRFLREARAAGLLAHPNLVTVFDAGEDAGVCYIAAEYCPGPTLSKWLADHHQTPAPPRAAAALVADLADGVGYAHRRNVVHRDIKPSNVLLAAPAADLADWPADPPADKPFPFHPKVTDFGVAKIDDGSGDVTRDGVVIGTPDYMAPEQADGRVGAVGPPADVYALGGVLYRLLVGCPPHKADTPQDTMRRRVADPPPRVRGVRPDVPKDLEAVCLRCLATAPAERYPDGDALAADLRRFLAGEPTLARPVGPGERLVKWAKRNKPAAALVAVLVAAAAGYVVLTTLWTRQLRAANEALAAETREAKQRAAEAKTAEQRAAGRKFDLLSAAYLSEVRFAGAVLAAGRRPPADLLRDPTRGDPDLRGWEWHYLRRAAGDGVLWREHPDAVADLVAADGGRVLASRAANDVRVWHAGKAASGNRWWPAVPMERLLAADPDGRTVLGVLRPAGGEPVLSVFDAHAGRYLGRRTLAPADRAEEARGSDDGLRLVARFADRLERLDPRTAAGSPLACGGVPLALAVSADGSTAAAWVVEPDGTGCRLVVLDLDKGTVRATVRSTLPGTPELAASADGRRVALASGDGGRLEVWDVPPGGPPAKAADRPFPGHANARPGFLADGRVAVAGWGHGDSAGDLELGVWHPADGSFAVRRVEPGCMISALAVLPSGRLAVGGSDHTIRLLNPDPPPLADAWAAHGTRPATSQREVWGLAVSPDATTLVTGGDDGRVRVWDAATRAIKATLTRHAPALASAAAFAPDGRTFATAGYNNLACVWDAANPADATAVRLPHPKRVRAVAYSPDGKLLATACEDNLLRLWTPAGELVRELAGHDGKPKGLAFVSDARLVSVGNDDAVRWWDVPTGKLVRTDRESGTATCVAVSPDRGTIATGTADGHLVLRAVSDGRVKSKVAGPPARVTAIAFDPAGKTIATAATDGAVRLWRAGAGDELFALPAGGPIAYGLAFAPDGSALYAGRHDGTVARWAVR